MKRTPTFRLGHQLLVGEAARAAWAAQTARCGCGDYGDTDNTVSGSAGDMPAEWLGCPNCSGSAVGRPLVFRVQSQIAAARSLTAAESSPSAALSMTTCHSLSESAQRRIRKLAAK